MLSGLVWLGMLLGMLLWWLVDQNGRQLPAMDGGHTIAYISDIGSSSLQPLFIAMSAVTVVLLDVGFLAERWLRHTGRLAPNTSRTQKALSILSIIFAIAGAAGLILLSIFDNLNHPRLHDGFLLLFLAGYIISAICLCAEYQRLGIHYRHHRILAISFWTKLAFILVEVVLAIVFIATMFTGHTNIAAVFEWIIAFIFTFYVLSFVIDLLPSVRTSKHIPQGHKDIMMAEQGLPASAFTRGGAARNANYEQNLTNDSAGPNQEAARMELEDPRQRSGKLSRLFSNLY